MPVWFTDIIGHSAIVILTLVTTLLFNKFVGLPKDFQKQKEINRQKEEQDKQENRARDLKIYDLENTMKALPAYKAHSLQIQAQLQSADKDILAVCNDIKNSVTQNQKVLDGRLDRLEKREKNAIRAKLLDEYRLFTDEAKNPMLAWSEMEHHAFFEVTKDYEDLNGNDYVHTTVIPAMNKLVVVPMSDKATSSQMMNSRKL